MKNPTTQARKTKTREIARSEDHVDRSLAQFEAAMEHLEEKVIEGVEKVQHVKETIVHTTEKVQHAIDTARHPERIVHQGIEATREAIAPYLEKGKQQGQKLVANVKSHPRTYGFGAALLLGGVALYFYLNSRRKTPWQRVVQQLPMPRF